MYPRNNASPDRIPIGNVIQISDGAIQSSGVSVTVTPNSGSENAGTGTVGYLASGVVTYIPNQAETNYSSFIVTAYKAGCYPVAVGIVTTASSVAGQVALSATQLAYPPAKAGDAMTLTADYDAAKNAASPGAEMDLVDAPNATALAAVKVALALLGVNIRQINGIAIDGSGTQIDPWGPV